MHEHICSTHCEWPHGPCCGAYPRNLARKRWYAFHHELRLFRRNHRFRTDEISWDRSPGERAMRLLAKLPALTLSRTIG